MSKVCIEPFAIKIVDSKTGRGVPLVELRTTHGVKFYTDSAGVISFEEESLMNQEVFFYIESDGYQYKEDKHGYRGETIFIEPGGSITLEIERINIAERLYRVTGQGIYTYSTRLGLDVPLDKPNLNGKVTGCDTVQATVYNGKVYWFWGDTHGPFHPLGNFRTTGVTSKLPKDGGLHPSEGVNLEYFVDESGFVKEMVPPLPDGAPLVWVSPPMVVKDSNGRERLVIGYASLHELNNNVGRGVLMFNDETEQLEQLAAFDDEKHPEWAQPTGGGTLVKEEGKEYWLFTRPQPVVRVLSDIEAMKDPFRYEAYSPFKPGTGYKGADTELDRDEKGNLIWGWKLNTEPISQKQEDELIELGLIDPKKDNPHYQYYDVDTGDKIVMHSNTIRWNEYRKRWVIIGSQVGGRSLLGETWYGESDSPQGPWGPLKRIITHKAMSFYNPIQHEYFQEDYGRIIYFEGTYTTWFTNEKPTPYYDYNQIMYRLDLDDPRLGLPLDKK